MTPTGKKEDNPEEALKAFKAIVDQEEEKGDWCVRYLSMHIIHAKLFGLFCPKFPDCDGLLQHLAGVYGCGIMCPSLCLNLGISSVNE